jgi:hypothetical protein
LSPRQKAKNDVKISASVAHPPCAVKVDATLGPLRVRT